MILAISWQLIATMVAKIIIQIHKGAAMAATKKVKVSIVVVSIQIIRNLLSFCAIPAIPEIFPKT
jgi:hypothetical protein